jgi:Fe(3+) dicitrate transport protein
MSHPSMMLPSHDNTQWSDRVGRRRALLLALSVIAAAQSLMTAGVAQTHRAALSGHLRDQSGASISGASVTLQQKATTYERTVITDAAGNFRFDNLVQGQYRLSASGAGFAAIRQEVTLSPGESRQVQLVLQPGPVAEEILISSSQIIAAPETAKRIPGAVETIDRQMLENSRVFTFTEALRKVSGLNVRDEEGFGLRPNIGIRGLNPTRSTKVLLLEDGIPLAYAPYGDNSSYYHPPIDRFDSIEVLKGSGQILYGPVTVGGVINYLTPAPPDKPSGSVTLIGGNRSYFNGHLSYGGTWKNTGLIFNYLRKQGAGARENTRSGLHDFTFKSVTTLTPKQALTLKANYYGEDSNVTYSGLREDEFRANPRQNPFRNDFFFGDRYGAAATHAYVFSNHVVLTTNLYGAIFERKWWRQSSNSNQRPNDSADPNCGGLANLNTTCGNEGRLRKYYTFGVDPRLRISSRLFGTRSETDLGFRAHFERQERRQENGPLPTSRSGVVVENNQRKNQAYSAFLQHRFTLGDWTITPGFRVEHINFERTNRLLGVTGRTELTQAIPGLGISYSPGASLTIFAGAHRGFAPPRTEDIINNTTGGSIDLDPELSWNYELGLRAQPHPGVRLEATYFRMDYENQIVPASLAGGVGATLTNGGQTLHQGAEVTARADAGTLLGSAHNFYVRAAYTYLPRAKFTGARFSSVSGFTQVSVSGNRLPYAPEHLLNVQLGYSHPRGLDTLLEAVRVSDQFGDDLNTVAPTPDGQRGLIPAYTIWNATVNYHVESRRTTFFITVKNLLDRTFIVDRARGILPSAPRQMQAGVKFRF